MVFRAETLWEKKKSSGRKVYPNLSKMPRTGRKEKTSHNTTKIVTKCNYATKIDGRNRQKQTEYLAARQWKTEIIFANKMLIFIANK